MTGFAKLLDRFLFLVIGLLLAVMVVDVTIQVFWRYVIQDPPTWTEELARYVFSWEIFLGMALAFGRGTHIVVDALVSAVPRPIKRVLLLGSNLLVLAFLLVLVWQGASMVGMTSNTTSTAMELNMGVVYAGLPTGAAIAALYVVMTIANIVRGVDQTSQTLLMD
ncbi:MAG TPA: TRAP transporter small permease [Chloroflexota bacterium]